MYKFAKLDKKFLLKMQIVPIPLHFFKYILFGVHNFYLFSIVLPLNFRKLSSNMIYNFKNINQIFTNISFILLFHEEIYEWRISEYFLAVT